MTLLEEVIERIRALPPSDRESVAETMLAVVEQYEHAYHPTPEQIEELKQAERDLDAGKMEFLTDEEVDAMWTRFGA